MNIAIINFKHQIFHGYIKVDFRIFTYTFCYYLYIFTSAHRVGTKIFCGKILSELSFQCQNYFPGFCLVNL